MTESSGIVIAGAGPAGLACARELSKEKRPYLLIDENAQPGGLCRTIDFNGYLFDIGGHRFLTSSPEVQALWDDIMGEDLLKVKRLSRIYYRGKYFNYPLSFVDTVLKLGPIESLLCFLSYARYKFFPYHEQDSFEGWIIHNFGKRLYNIFFKTYTEKVWAVPCKDLSSDWAVQRIMGLSLQVAIKRMLGFDIDRGPKTLAERFLYPKTGPGEFYKRFLDSARVEGAEYWPNRRIVRIRHDGKRIVSVDVKGKREADACAVKANQLFSSMPLPEAVLMFDPPAPAEVQDAARKLAFRSYLVVNVILDKEHVFPDQWIYVHSPEVRMGRIQNYKNWSPAMAADPNKTSLGLEYFCNTGDELWNMDDLDLIDFALKELERTGIASRKHYINGFVVRYKNAYPLYSMGYMENVMAVRKYLERFSNFQTMGRGGLFRYDNSDHSLLAGMYAAANYMGHGHHDVWAINVGKKYLES